jgi:hypothetical protein
MGKSGAKLRDKPKMIPGGPRGQRRQVVGSGEKG